MVDLAALTAAVYARLKSDSAGDDARTLLGAGADSVLLAEDLRVEGLTIAQLPERPLIALRRGPAPTDGRVVSRPIYTWYCYDDPATGYGNLEQLPLAVANAYDTALMVNSGDIGRDVVVSAGAQTRDDRLGLLLVPITVAIGAI